MFRFNEILMVLVMTVILTTASTALRADILPAANSAVALRYEADSITGVDGDAVATWSDLSGHYNLTQSTAVNRPLLRTDDNIRLNGHQIVQFYGYSPSYHWMNTDAFSSPLAQADHVFLVIKDVSPTREQSVFDEYGATTTNRQGFIIDDVNSGAHAGGYVGANFNDTAWHVHELLYNGANSFWAVDGATPVTGDAGPKSLSQLLVGATSHNGTAPTEGFFRGQMAELIFFNRALDLSERNQIGDYLGDKYGLTTAYYVPEPGSLVLLSVGLIGLLAYAWRKRK